MIVVKILAVFLLVLGLALLALGLWLGFGGHDLAIAGGQLWFALDKESLNTAQVVVQRYIYPDLWDWIFVPLLLRPAWQALAIPTVGFLVLGGALFVLAQRRRRKSFRR